MILRILSIIFVAVMSVVGFVHTVQYIRGDTDTSVKFPASYQDFSDMGVSRCNDKGMMFISACPVNDTIVDVSCLQRSPTKVHHFREAAVWE